MSAGPFLDLTLFRDKLETELIPQGVVRQVGHAAQIATVTEGAFKTPSVWVVPDRITGTGPEGNGWDRIISMRVGIITVVMDASADRGEDALATLNTVTNQIWESLNRWEPSAKWSKTHWESGGLLGVKEYTYTWLDRYFTQVGVSQ